MFLFGGVDASQSRKFSAINAWLWESSVKNVLRRGTLAIPWGVVVVIVVMTPATESYHAQGGFFFIGQLCNWNSQGLRVMRK